MKHGFIKVGTGCIKTHLADTQANAKEIIKLIKEADQKGVKLLTLPELCITGASLGDLFYNTALLKGALSALEEILKESADTDITFTVGIPLMLSGKLYNCVAVINGGDILGVVPSEKHSDIFAVNNSLNVITLLSRTVPFGNDIVFRHSELENFSFCVAVGENADALNNAVIKINPTASVETVGKAEKRRLLCKADSLTGICGILYASCGEGESTTDAVYSGHLIISENGKLLCENQPMDKCRLIISEIDVDMLCSGRSKNSDFYLGEEYTVYFQCKTEETLLTRKVRENPFIPESKEELESRIETILNLQASALARRIEHTHSKTIVIGVSGGLDSTLALFVCAKAMDSLNRPRTDIIAVTLPCFGTTARTKSNAVLLCEELKVTLKEIDITKAVRQHFADIGHSEAVTDVTYENSQARERTQVLMDLAGEHEGFVVGTGDISELALGWATYNGDHMSMYSVNGGIPKTLMRCIVNYVALSSNDALSSVLCDILDTPVSPELLPVDNKGEISQKTEDLVGPYELHDFFLYYMCRYGFSPEKIYRLCRYALAGKYSDDIIKKWLKIFMRRFFSQQFKRSCIPDGVKVGSVSLSPRGDWQMPSDALSTLWLSEAEDL